MPWTTRAGLALLLALAPSVAAAGDVPAPRANPADLPPIVKDRIGAAFVAAPPDDPAIAAILRNAAARPHLAASAVPIPAAPPAAPLPVAPPPTASSPLNVPTAAARRPAALPAAPPQLAAQPRAAPARLAAPPAAAPPAVASIAATTPVARSLAYAPSGAAASAPAAAEALALPSPDGALVALPPGRPAPPSGAAADAEPPGELREAVPLPPDKPRRPPPRTRVAAVAVPSRTDATPEAPASVGVCLAGLRSAKVSYAVLPAIAVGACGAEVPLRVTDIAGITLSPPATLRCEMASAAADWVRDSLVPASRKLGTTPTQLTVAASYACRTRITGRGPSSKLSEHGRANALDIGGVKFADGREMAVMASGSGRGGAMDAFQADIRQGGCAAFRTVLGPGADPAHSNHLHFDLAPRRHDTVICH